MRASCCPGRPACLRVADPGAVACHPAQLAPGGSERVSARQRDRLPILHDALSSRPLHTPRARTGIRRRAPSSSGVRVPAPSSSTRGATRHGT
jgi:hypothetical protein